MGMTVIKDKCINCNCETLYDNECHIDQRLGYVEGAGQLCLDCWEKIYKTKQNKEQLDEKITVE